MAEGSGETIQQETQANEFPLLRYPKLYSPCTFSLVASKENEDNEKYPSFKAWIEVFRASTPTFKKAAESDPDPDLKKSAKTLAKKFENEYLAYLKDVELQMKNKGAAGYSMDIMQLCVKRDDILRKLGFQDCFRAIKAEENAKAMLMLSSVCEEIDKTAEDERLLLLLKGVFAGNIFDLGAAKSAELYSKGGGAADFNSTRDKLAERPWLIDDYDELLVDWDDFAYSKAILFVDNAGADVVLGMLPLARELVRKGADVVLAANEVPSINDITAAELTKVLSLCSEPLIETYYKQGKIKVVSSGNSMPVIDLRKVSPELCEEAMNADLVILEGMGRSIETNLNAQFVCDVLKLGMIKHPEVADALRGQVYDVVCKFDPGSVRNTTRSLCSLQDFPLSYCSVA
mmetsp:Transcript_41512/g.79337  ORF Transcript_41512/g.79337 Transcript_41512/m.79337 type:complete len:402 (+) Transcript_41512:54-1259(+)